MLYICLKPDSLRYVIYETVKLFYDDKDIIFTGNEPPVENGGVFLSVELFDERGRSELKLQMTSEEESLSRCVPVAAAGGNGQHGSRKALKWQLKRELYIMLSKYTKRDLPWGILTGIRPVKIVHAMLEKGLTKNEVTADLKKFYKVSEVKAGLVYDIAETELRVLGRTEPDMIGIYIGIPFCTSRCLYCSFASNPIKGRTGRLVDKYLEALKHEISSVCRIIEDCGYRAESIYIGGGTPTSITAGQLEDLLLFIEKSFNLQYLKEYTLEAGRPDSIDREKLELIRKSRATRISINPQSMNDETLKAIGRNHTSGDIKQAFKLARDIGFDNINMDIIAGLPGETLSMFRHTLDEIREMNPESLTVHTMSLKRASRLNEEKDRHYLISGEEAANMIDMARSHAHSMGMHPYYLYRQKNILGNLENIGYSRSGFESVYNIQIMEEKQTIIALGADAVTKVVYPSENRIERAFNVKDVEQYIKRIDEMVERKRTLLCSRA